MSDDRNMMYDISCLGKNIATLRRNTGLTQEMLALQVGVSAQAVSKWERGMTCPDLSLLPILAELFDVPIDVLFQEAKDPDALLPVEGLPWQDDGKLRVAVFEGKSLCVREVYECPETAVDMLLLLRPDGGGREHTCLLPMGDK